MLQILLIHKIIKLIQHDILILAILFKKYIYLLTITSFERYFTDKWRFLVRFLGVRNIIWKIKINLIQI